MTQTIPLLTPPREIVLPALVMRAWSIADVESLGAALAASDAHLRPWTPWVLDGREPGLSLQERLANHDADFASGRAWVYGLFTPDRREVLGGCGLYARVGPRAVELGYWLASGHTGRGLATRAAAALTDLAFASPNIDCVEIRCERRNVASARVPERLGYRLATDVDGVADDMLVWRKTRDSA